MTQWLVMEAYSDLYYTTGVTYQADNQPTPTTVLGSGVDVSVLPIIGLSGRMDWGVHAYSAAGNGVDPRNGGIVTAAGGVAFADAGFEIVGPPASARRSFALRRGSRHEGAERLVVAELAARLREEMHRRRPAARHEDEVAAQVVLVAAADRGKSCRMDAMAAFGSRLTPGTSSRAPPP